MRQIFRYWKKKIVTENHNYLYFKFANFSIPKFYMWGMHSTSKFCSHIILFLTSLIIFRILPKMSAGRKRRVLLRLQTELDHYIALNSLVFMYCITDVLYSRSLCVLNHVCKQWGYQSIFFYERTLKKVPSHCVGCPFLHSFQKTVRAKS